MPNEPTDEILVLIALSNNEGLGKSAHTQRMNVDEVSDQILDFQPHWICQHECLLEAFAQNICESNKII